MSADFVDLSDFDTLVVVAMLGLAVLFGIVAGVAAIIRRQWL